MRAFSSCNTGCHHRGLEIGGATGLEIGLVIAGELLCLEVPGSLANKAEDWQR